MSNVSIYEKKWLDLVFEGKNKEYGAYKLRQNYLRTTAQAFVFGVVLLSSFIFLLSSFKRKIELVPAKYLKETIIKLHTYKPPVTNTRNLKQQSQKQIKTEIKIPINHNFVAVKPEDVLQQPTELEIPKNSLPENGISTAGIPSILPKTTRGNEASVVIEKPKDTSVKKSFELDRQPSFAGGIKNFYEYIGSHFDRSNLDEDTSVRVLVTFVIEKDGSMSDIKVVAKTNQIIDNEAVRVLKSIKTKWTPGIKDGESVRTQFTQPIIIKV